MMLIAIYRCFNIEAATKLVLSLDSSGQIEIVNLFGTEQAVIYKSPNIQKVSEPFEKDIELLFQKRL